MSANGTAAHDADFKRVSLRNKGKMEVQKKEQQSKAQSIKVNIYITADIALFTITDQLR